MSDPKKPPQKPEGSIRVSRSGLPGPDWLIDAIDQQPQKPVRPADKKTEVVTTEKDEEPDMSDEQGQTEEVAPKNCLAEEFEKISKATIEVELPTSMLAKAFIKAQMEKADCLIIPLSGLIYEDTNAWRSFKKSFMDATKAQNMDVVQGVYFYKKDNYWTNKENNFARVWLKQPRRGFWSEALRFDNVVCYSAREDSLTAYEQKYRHGDFRRKNPACWVS